MLLLMRNYAVFYVNGNRALCNMGQSWTKSKFSSDKEMKNIECQIKRRSLLKNKLKLPKCLKEITSRRGQSYGCCFCGKKA